MSDSTCLKGAEPIQMQNPVERTLSQSERLLNLLLGSPLTAERSLGGDRLLRPGRSL